MSYRKNKKAVQKEQGGDIRFIHCYKIDVVIIICDPFLHLETKLGDS